MNWVAVGAIAEIVGAAASIAIAGVAVYVGVRQWVDGKRVTGTHRTDLIVRAQSLDSYFDGISTLLLRDEDGIFTDTARSLTKGRTDAVLKILKADEKLNLIAFLYGSGLISRDGEGSVPMVALSGSDLSHVELNGTSLQHAGFGLANLRGAAIQEADLNGVDLRGTDLSQADLTGSDLSEANLHGVVAAAALLNEVDLSDADLSGSKIDNVDLSGANLREVNLTGAFLQGAQFSNLVSIDGADFSGASGVSSESAEYLVSIASGSRPETSRQTAQTLGDLSTSEMAEDRV